MERVAYLWRLFIGNGSSVILSLVALVFNTSQNSINCNIYGCKNFIRCVCGIIAYHVCLEKVFFFPPFFFHSFFLLLLKFKKPKRVKIFFFFFFEKRKIFFFRKIKKIFFCHFLIFFYLKKKNWDLFFFMGVKIHHPPFSPFRRSIEKFEKN